MARTILSYKEEKGEGIHIRKVATKLQKHSKEEHNRLRSKHIVEEHYLI